MAYSLAKAKGPLEPPKAQRIQPIGLAGLAGDDQGTKPAEQQQHQAQDQLAGGGSQVGVLGTTQVQHGCDGKQQRGQAEQ